MVIEEELSHEEVLGLQGVHERIYGLDIPWAQHLEGSYFPKEVLRSMRASAGHSGISTTVVAHSSNLITAIPSSFGGWFVNMGSPWQGLLQHCWSIRSLLKRCARKSWQLFMTGVKRFWPILIPSIIGFIRRLLS